MEVNKIYNEDCLEGMKRIPDGVIDMILCDLPFGSTACHWDKKLPLSELWSEYKRIAKTSAAIILFANNKFEIELVVSAFELFKYKWVWIKNTPTNFIQCKHRPMVKHEDILVFSKGTAANGGKNNITYNPQGIKICGQIYNGAHKENVLLRNAREMNKKYTNYKREYTNYPQDVLYFAEPPSTKKIHPSQKPVDLLEYLIKTYTNEGELVLDNCIGSGSTAVAAINTNRNFIGFETDSHFCEVARLRVEEAVAAREMRLAL